MEKLRSAVIGLGQIGMGYDLNQSSSSIMLTHAKTFASHCRFELVAGLDLNPEKRENFTKKYGAPAFIEIKQLMREVKPDIVSICTNTDTHFGVCKEVLSYRPKAIICEKPICYSLEEASELLRISAANDVPILVNYMRRFEPGAKEVRLLLHNGAIGPLQRGSVLYSKGLYNNASHFIDLLSFWLGPPKLRKVSKKGRRFPKNDIEPDFVLTFSGVEFSFQSLKEECFSIAEISIFGEGGKISYLEGGSKIELWKTRDDPGFPGYRIFEKEPIIVKNDFSRYQFYVMDELVRFLDRKVDFLSSDLKEAFCTLRIVDEIRTESEFLGVGNEE